MKRAVILMLAIFAMGTMSAQQTVEKTLVKPVNLLGKMEVDVNMNGEVSIKEWSNNHAQIEMSISATGINSQVLKSLVAAGRYNIKIDVNGPKIVLTTPNLAKALKVGGHSLNDKVTYIIYVPTACVVNTAESDGMTSVN